MTESQIRNLIDYTIREQEQISENKPTTNMKKIKLTDSKLNEIIKRVIREQEDQVSSTGPAPEEVSGSPEAEDGAPNFEAFVSAAQELLGQGITIGELVDKLIETQNPQEPEPEALPTEPEPDSAIPSDNQ